MTQMYIGLHAKCLVCCPISTTFELCQQILVHIPVSNFTKIHPVVAKLFHMKGWRDGQTDIMKQSQCLQLFHESA